MSVQYMGVTEQWRISWVHQVNIMSTFGGGGIPQVQIQLLYVLSLFQIKEFYIGFVLS